MPLYMRSLGFSVTDWGMMAMSHAIGMVLLEWFWGFLSDKVDRRVFIAISLIGMSIIFPLYTFKGLGQYFIILQILMGALAVINGPITRALISDYSSAETIGMNLSLWSVIMTVGRMVGSVAGSYTAQVLSFEQSFYISSILSISGGLAVLTEFRRNDHRLIQEPKKDTKMMRDVKTLMSDASIWILLSIAATSFMALSVTFSFLPLYASEMVGMSLVEIGSIPAIMSLTQLLAAPIYGRISNRTGNKPLLIFGFSLATMMLLTFSLIETPIQIFLVSIGLSIGLSASPLLVAILYEVTPRRLLGLSMGMYGSFEDFGMMMGAPLYGFVWSLYAPHYIFIVGAAVQSLSIPLVHRIKIKVDGR